MEIKGERFRVGSLRCFIPCHNRNETSIKDTSGRSFIYRLSLIQRVLIGDRTNVLCM